MLSRRSLGSARKELGYHGFIALFVLVERRHVASMAWQELTVAHSTVRRGKKVLGIRALTAANKGAVGTACRFHGTTIAFVGAHLNSDKRGVSKLEKRIRDTRYVCEGIELGFDALGFGLEACVHHVILLGDLNFRVGLPLGTALERMAHGRWESLLAADELSTAMAQRRVLSGWREAPIAFLPTYRRRPAGAPVAAGDADEDGGDGLGATAGRRSLSDAGAAVAALEAAYTLHVDGSERTPSYTDRVLLHSLPGLEPQLTCVDYDACELLTASDHRPVAADLVLSVPAAAGAATGADAARSPRRHSLVVRGGGSLRCQLRLSELTLHDDDAAERLALFPMSSVADGAAVEPSLGERASSLPLVPPGSLAEAANEIGPPPRGLSALDARALELAFPMPAEDPSASMNRVAALFGRQGRGALLEVPWADALADGVTAVADLEIAHGHVAHAIVKLVDAERAPLGQGVLSVALPWSAAAPGAAADARPFSIDLSLSGAYVGQLRGVCRRGGRAARRRLARLAPRRRLAAPATTTRGGAPANSTTAAMAAARTQVSRESDPPRRASRACARSVPLAWRRAARAGPQSAV